MTLNIVEMQSLLKSGGALCATVDAMLNSKYGEDWYLWDPSTIWMELRDDFQVQVDTDVMDKVGAAQVIMTGDGFFRRVDAFSGVANTLGGSSPGFQMMDPVTPEEAVWAIIEVAVMRDSLTFSPSVQDFIKTVFSGQEAHPIVSYAVNSEVVDNEEIVRMALEAVGSPNGPVDEYIVEQMKDLRSQLTEANLNAYVAVKLW